ncbi:MAG: crossover junction endodeoxyribonuclease RuvC [Thermodesulfovibrionales bacterium]|nr:crossover junction endodeoxyribonuclease RuvC [Thermodesulfovibrionales bacterium]
MVILGIDPGSQFCGYGIIKCNSHCDNSNCSHIYIASGRIIMPLKAPLFVRLKELFLSIREVIQEYKPDEVSIEKIFFAKGIKSAITLGHTRGVIISAVLMNYENLYEYSPLEIKKAVVGYGKADKNQVQVMVSKILNIRHPISSDSADALATAICHANSRFRRY